MVPLAGFTTRTPRGVCAWRSQLSFETLPPLAHYASAPALTLNTRARARRRGFLRAAGIQKPADEQQDRQAAHPRRHGGKHAQAEQAAAVVAIALVGTAVDAGGVRAGESRAAHFLGLVRAVGAVGLAWERAIVRGPVGYKGQDTRYPDMGSACSTHLDVQDRAGYTPVSELPPQTLSNQPKPASVAADANNHRPTRAARGGALKWCVRGNTDRRRR